MTTEIRGSGVPFFQKGNALGLMQLFVSGDTKCKTVQRMLLFAGLK